MDKKTDACPFCESSEYNKHYRILSRIGDKSVSYFRCRKCRSIMQYPHPDESTLTHYYNNYIEIKTRMNPGYLEQTAYRLLVAERDASFRDIGFSKRIIPDSVNIELGCANGHFLRYLNENGSRTTIGIDRSKALLDMIKLDNVTLIHGTLNAIPDTSGDNIFLFNVLEHIPGTSEVLREIVRISKPDSKILIEIPLTGFIQNRFGSKWRFLMPDEHLNIPSRKGLKILLKKHNLKITSQTRFGSGITAGTVPRPVKVLCDFLAKGLRIGDRGVFLVERIRGKR